ncbi:MAG: hypothetical protein ACD_21C00332G0005 [uncultured bacterium]|nr:MAG: hypothetical protein ACD_21C00332G0005 [uncultured bacterium]
MLNRDEHKLEYLKIPKISIVNDNATLRLALKTDCLASITKLKENHVQKGSRNKSAYLSAEVIRKILNRFLSEKGMSIEQLAKKLGAEIGGLKQILSAEPSVDLAHKINLPLIKLYCKTKFNSLNNK